MAEQRSVSDQAGNGERRRSDWRQGASDRSSRLDVVPCLDVERKVTRTNVVVFGFAQMDGRRRRRDGRLKRGFTGQRRCCRGLGLAGAEMVGI